jgi:hypothetical protein
MDKLDSVFRREVFFATGNLHVPQQRLSGRVYYYVRLSVPRLKVYSLLDRMQKVNLIYSQGEADMLKKRLLGFYFSITPKNFANGF